MACSMDLNFSVCGTSVEAQRPRISRTCTPPGGLQRSSSVGGLASRPCDGRQGSRGGFSLVALDGDAGRGQAATAVAESAEIGGAAGSQGRTSERAKEWSPQVEDLYRLQFCGWRDVGDYVSTHGEPERWPDVSDGSGALISKVRLKANGFYTYWRRFRQCDDQGLKKVRVYAAAPGTAAPPAAPVAAPPPQA